MWCATLAASQPRRKAGKELRRNNSVDFHLNGRLKHGFSKQKRIDYFCTTPKQRDKQMPQDGKQMPQQGGQQMPGNPMPEVNSSAIPQRPGNGQQDKRPNMCLQMTDNHR